jgi:hypothetical protein
MARVGRREREIGGEIGGGDYWIDMHGAVTS